MKLHPLAISPSSFSRTPSPTEPAEPHEIPSPPSLSVSFSLSSLEEAQPKPAQQIPFAMLSGEAKERIENSNQNLTYRPESLKSEAIRKFEFVGISVEI